MSDRAREELTTRELERLRDVADVGEPPESLERRVIERLLAEGLIEGGRSSSRRVSRWSRTAGAVAAGALLVLVGVLLGRAAPLVPTVDEPADSSYLLLLRGGEPPADDEALRASVSRMAAWLGDLQSQGLRVTGERLAETGWTLEEPNGRGRRLSSRANEAAEGSRVAGFFRVDGVSEEEVVALAATCPFLLRGGSVEVRRIDQGGGRGE